MRVRVGIQPEHVDAEHSGLLAVHQPDAPATSVLSAIHPLVELSQVSLLHRTVWVFGLFFVKAKDALTLFVGQQWCLNKFEGLNRVSV